MDGRIYYGLDRLNQEFIDWIDVKKMKRITIQPKSPLVNYSKKEYLKLQKYYEKKNDEIVIHSVYHDTVEYRYNLYKWFTRHINSLIETLCIYQLIQVENILN